MDQNFFFWLWTVILWLAIGLNLRRANQLDKARENAVEMMKFYEHLIRNLQRVHPSKRIFKVEE